MGRPVALKHQLALALVLPATAVIAATAYFAEDAAERALDLALGDRLTAVALAAAQMVEPNVLLLERGDDDFRSRKNALAKLRGLRDATRVDRVLVVRFDDLGALVDTAETLAVGDEYGRALFDRAELTSVRAGHEAASVLFVGPEGRRYKTGYAPFLDEESEVAGFVAVHGEASFLEAIDALRTIHAAILLGGLGLLLAFAIGLARGASIPLQRLAEAAERIGRGELSAEIPEGGPAEAVVLSTTMRSMARALADREAELQMMLAGIAHEVRNPLGGIELFGGLLKEDLAADDPRQRHVDKILRELKALSRVVNEFLEFARRAEPELRPTPLGELLEEVVSLATADATSAGVEVVVSAPAPELGLDLDRDAVRRAILNLVRNGIQASPRGGRVELRVEVGARTTAIIVSDTGPGIPLERRREVFAPFFTTKEKGTGLGLALVKKTVEAHGGTIRVEDAASGGAALVIELPSPRPA